VGVLLVCMGNICRSPTAEGLLRRRVETAGMEARFRIDSAGTHGYHVGAAPDERAVAAAARRDISLDKLRARQVERADFERFDFILAMDQDNLRDLAELGATAGRARVELLLAYSERYPNAAVPDPYYGGTDGFERVLDMLEDGINGFLQTQLRPRQR